MVLGYGSSTHMECTGGVLGPCGAVQNELILHQVVHQLQHEKEMTEGDDL